MDIELYDDVAMLKSELRCVIPSPGQIWHWEPMKSHASTRLLVTGVKISPVGEILIQTARPHGLGRNYDDTSLAWNTLGRWMEAAVLVDPAPGEG